MRDTMGALQFGIPQASCLFGRSIALDLSDSHNSIAKIYFSHSDVTNKCTTTTMEDER